ncbi:MAG: Helicase associated domain protein [Chitinophagaceae bacterium]|nr:Helicase associated domain protein [Chitinophagaceae bacterium]
MQVNFIGHGLHSENQINVGEQLAASFSDNKIFDSFHGFVAFAASSGILKLDKSLNIAQQNFKKLVFYIGVDNKGTSKQALELLLEKGIETYIYHREEEYITYHPKLFLFEGQKHTRVIIGSSNLTRSGFINNIEACIQLDFQPATDKQGNKLLSEVKEYFQEFFSLQSQFLFKLDKELITKYDEQGLLYSQFEKGTEKETQPTDGENDVPTEEVFIPEDIIFENGELPNERNYSNKPPVVTDTDFENFEIFLPQYVEYKNSVNPTGVINDNTQYVENRPLVNWYDRIKELIRFDILPLELELRLREVGFPVGDGKYSRSAYIWEQNFQKLKQYMLAHKQTRAYVPQHKDRNHPDYALGQWFARQKLRRKKKITPYFLEGEFEKLQSVGFVWETMNAGGKSDDDVWLDNYFQLETAWNERPDKLKLPLQKSPDGKWLIGKWLADQIANYKNTTRKNANGEVLKLLPERAAIIEELCGKQIWNWEQYKREQILNTQIERYLEFRKKYPNEKPDDDRSFDDVLQWKSQTRYRYKGDTSEKNKWRMDILNSDRVKFPWDE